MSSTFDVEQLYQEIILDHYREKHHSGLRDPYQAQVHHVNPSCGDELTLRAQLDGDRIADLSYEGVGCSISQASTSVMTDLVIGRTVEEAMDLYEGFREIMDSRGQAEPDEDRFEDGIAFIGVSQFPARIKCALLSWAAMKDAVSQSLGEEPAADAGDATAAPSTSNDTQEA